MGQIRPAFVYLLAVVLILYAVLSGGQAIGRINDARESISAMASTDRVVQASKESLWQAETFLRETMAASLTYQVTWVKLDVSEQDFTNTLWIKGKEAQLLAFYEWFEKHARISSIKEMELDEDDAEAATLQIRFAW